MSGPALCMAAWVSPEHGPAHSCLLKRNHPGPHVCSREEHDIYASCGSGCCSWEESCGFTWDSSPKQMYMGSWKIETALPGDVVGDRSWPAARRIRVSYNGDTLIVGHDVTRGRELAIKYRDFNDWAIYDTEQR